MELPDRTPQTDREAFDRIVALHHGSIRRLVFRLLGWRDGGEDVVQEVFLAAWRAWGRFRGESSAELWLKRIAVNQCRSRLRREAVRARWLGWFRANGSAESRAAPADVLAREEQAARVRAAINSLAPRYREVTVLHYLEELSLDQIAQVVGARRNTVEVRLHRARRQLEGLLADLDE